MKTLVIVNPTAGAGRAGERAAAAREILRGSGSDVEWIQSKSSDHLTALAFKASRSGVERVIVAGGDGSISFVAKGLLGSETGLGILPVGSGNDMAAGIGLPRDTRAAARMLMENHLHTVDVGEVADRIFCCVLGVGLDTRALEITRDSKMRRGRLLYALAAVRALWQYRPQYLAVTSGETRFQGRILFAAISNTRTYGGGLPISPLARMSDGMLDLCVIPGMNRVRGLMIFGNLVVGAHVNRSGVVSLRGERIKLESETPLPLTLDGELTELRTPMEVKVRRGALRLLGGPLPV